MKLQRRNKSKVWFPLQAPKLLGSPMPLIETAHANLDLRPSPIEPSWIIEGNPEARSVTVATSSCGTATTMVWSCTEGKFNWYYDLDETVVIIEGSIVLDGEGMPSRRYGVGDVIFFREGAQAKWHVEGYMKKIAFLRQRTPFGFGLAIRAINRLLQMSPRRSIGGHPSWMGRIRTLRAEKQKG